MQARSPTAIVDFAAPPGPPGRRIFGAPVDVLTAPRLDDVRATLARVERAVASGLHAVGCVAYEAAPAFDAALRVREGDGLPLAWFALFREPLAADAASAPGSFSLSEWTPDVSRREYDAAIDAIREGIARGDYYQVNHTFRLRARFEGDPLGLYEKLRGAQGAGFCAYLDLGRWRVLSASPELFFRRAGDAVTVRPMKGTARRGRWAEDDLARREALARSAKDQAENVMIVDLLRNDLGRVSEIGSVAVPSLFDVEQYPTVWQMTSTITSQLRPGVTLPELFGALFPSGSVTGAPKVAAMRRIAGLERAPRGPYCGAIGVLAPGGDWTFNVGIRTLCLDTSNGEATYGVGGGITWDSTPEREYEEALLKARILTQEQPELELLETLRLEDGECRRLERHLQRLAQSARYFGFADPVGAAREALGALQHACPAGMYRVRVLAGRDGRVRIEHHRLTEVDRAAWARGLRAVLARTPVSAEERLLHYKTTHRALYETHRAAAGGADEVLLWNEAGELTEFTIGNLVVELDGRRWTPPLESGLVPGVFRAELLERGLVRERALRAGDLARATGVWLVNSVREWVPVTLRPEATDAAEQAPTVTPLAHPSSETARREEGA